jgi:hypothetical protein
MRLCLAVAALVAAWLGAAIAYAGPFDFPPSDFNIMNADGTQVIGHGHYEVTHDGNGYGTAFGEDRFNDGQYDIERDKLELRGDNQFPPMVTFKHTFFDANGTLQREAKADFQTGASPPACNTRMASRQCAARCCNFHQTRSPEPRSS